jgi:hypothetical protein
MYISFTEMIFSGNYSQHHEGYMATKKPKDEQTTDQKEIMFNDFFQAALGTMEALELHYEVEGVVEKVFGASIIRHEGQDAAKTHLRASRAWGELSALYDYALHGIVSELDGPDSVVINGADVLKLASSENHSPSTQWNDIIAMGDGRFALDDGEDMTIYKLSLLANVDQRTVRNAISAGQLVANKKNVLFEGEQLCIENATARRWLHGRKGFKPTIVATDPLHLSLRDVAGPAEFSAFLVSQRKRIGLDQDGGKLTVLHNCVDARAISQLEAGIFSLPLDAVFPLADFYQVSRKELLECVMRVFFATELMMLSPTAREHTGGGK